MLMFIMQSIQVRNVVYTNAINEIAQIRLLN